VPRYTQPDALKDTVPPKSIDQDADFYKKLLEALDEIKWNEDNLVSNGVRVSKARLLRCKSSERESLVQVACFAFVAQSFCIFAVQLIFFAPSFSLLLFIFFSCSCATTRAF
jgi:hypothetical protein